MSSRCSIIQRLGEVFCAFFKAEDVFLCHFKSCTASQLPSGYLTAVLRIPHAKEELPGPYTRNGSLGKKKKICRTISQPGHT